MATVTRLVDTKPLVIFSRNNCCMSHSIKELMRNFGANAAVYELDELPDGQQIERELVQLGCQPSVPAVFIGQRLIGGERQVMSLHLQNQLIPLLIRAGAIWVWAST